MNFISLLLLYFIFVALSIYMNRKKEHGLLFWVRDIIGGAIIVLLVSLIVGLLFAYLGLSLALLNTPAVLPLTAQGNTIGINVIIFNNEPNWGTYLPMPQYWSSAKLNSTQFICVYPPYNVPCNNSINYILGGINASQKKTVPLIVQAIPSPNASSNETFTILFTTGVDYFGWINEIFVSKRIIYCKYTPSQPFYTCEE